MSISIFDQATTWLIEVPNESLYHATSISLIATRLQLGVIRHACEIESSGGAGTNCKRAAGTTVVPPAIDDFAL
ncbi:hypothetical protein [Rhizobium gallicum]|uniref:hypothetical protein n=1 Tax=Rhizobium gallicum TaxID=56730 RepID=UPI001EF8B8C9|nr:hypothetical protein [Rhizobium gallicum]ULJ73808.1 hypothetical protein L2W42_09770 [Rhizobium gallicum]